MNGQQPPEDYIISGQWIVTGELHVEAHSEAEAQQAAQALANIESIYRADILKCKAIEKIEIDPSPERTFIFEGTGVVGLGDYFVTVKREDKQQAQRIVQQRLEELKAKGLKELNIAADKYEEYIFNGLTEANIPYRLEYIQYD